MDEVLTFKPFVVVVGKGTTKIKIKKRKKILKG